MRRGLIVLALLFSLYSFSYSGYIRGNIFYDGSRADPITVLVAYDISSPEDVAYTTLLAPGPWEIEGDFSDTVGYYALAAMIAGFTPVSGDPAGMYPDSPFYTRDGVATGIDITLEESGGFAGHITYDGDFANIYLNLYDAYGALFGGAPTLELILPVDEPDYEFTDIPSGAKMAQVFVDENENGELDDGELSVWYRNEQMADLFFIGGGMEFDNIDFNLTAITHANMPSSLELSRAFPNPFNSAVNFVCKLERTEAVSYSIYSQTGQFIETVHLGILSPGSHIITYTPGKVLPSGIYYVKFSVGANRLTRSFVYLR